MKSNFFEFVEDFIGGGTYGAAAAGSPWAVADTSAAGAPTVAVVTPSESGELEMKLASTTEIENLCLSFGDKLTFDIDNVVDIEIKIKQSQATIDSATSIAFGLASARNDAIDSIAAAALFRLVGSNAVLVETDDGVRDNDDVVTGKTLTSAYKTFLISFATGKKDVRFFVNGDPVATGTLFDMSGYSGSLQPFFQIQKTSDDNVDGITIDSIRVRGRKTLT